MTTGRSVSSLTAREALALVPHRNQSAQSTDGADGGVMIAVPVRRPLWLVPPLSWIIPFSSHRLVALDALGARILGLCDGQRSVEAIVEAFAEENRLTFREAQLPVSQYLNQLTQRGVVAIVGATPETSNQGE